MIEIDLKSGPRGPLETLYAAFEDIDGHACYGLLYEDQREQALQNIRDICRAFTRP